MSFKALDAVEALVPYAPGLSIAEIQEKYAIDRVIKLASNENPLGVPPLARESIARMAASAFRYPQGGNPRLVKALAEWHQLPPKRIVVGNGSDEIIDLMIRITCSPGKNSIVCNEPCFSLYPIQAQIHGVEARRCPLRKDFSFDFAGLLAQVDFSTRLVFLTTPDNPSGYCPPREHVEHFAHALGQCSPDCLLLIDEAYMDFAENEEADSLLIGGQIPPNVGFLRTFSKSFGLAGLRIGYGILPEHLAECFWRARLAFSVNILAEEAAIAALEDESFRQASMQAISSGRKQLAHGLEALGCCVWPSSANFLLFQLPPDAPGALDCFEYLLRKGVIIRALKSYNLPDYLRVSVGNPEENEIFLSNLGDYLAETRSAKA